ncbi:MAG: hypothetical protein Q7J84_03450 [Sulfuricaulis sp.]|nr:hypothetical protein [Sulfuricaulis sp.]
MNTFITKPSAASAAAILSATEGDELATALNRDCLCVTVNHDTLRRELDADGTDADLYREILATRPNLFSATAVFVTRAQVERMREIIRAVEAVVALPAYREAVLAEAPEIARFDPGPRGVFMGYDFHLGTAGPQLIEINTNAGGALLNTVLARAQTTCCETMKPLLPGPARVGALEDIFHQMFLREWRRQRGAQALTSIAIVDDAPREQYLYPEFVLFERLFRRHGRKAVIADPAELRIRDGKLWHEHQPIDLAYNRLTDFALAEPQHAVLRQAYLEGSVVLTPHPRAHALYADKRNLVALTDGARLRAWQVSEPVIHTLLTGIPRTVPVTRANAELLWARRRKLFFKPAAGYGGRAAYRGAKLTRRVWDEIVSGRYVAQEQIAPSERRLRQNGAETALKLDIRNYVYGGEVQLLAARLYQGQTTNFRTPGGGFAPVFCPAPEDDVSGNEIAGKEQA